MLKFFIVLFSFFLRQKVTINGKVTFADFVFRIRPPDCSKLTKNPKNDNDVTISWHDIIANFFDVVLFLLSSLVTGLSLISVSSLVLELRQFYFIRD